MSVKYCYASIATFNIMIVTMRWGRGNSAYNMDLGVSETKTLTTWAQGESPLSVYNIVHMKQMREPIPSSTEQWHMWTT